MAMVLAEYWTAYTQLIKLLCGVQADSKSQTARWSSKTPTGAAFAMALSQAKLNT